MLMPSHKSVTADTARVRTPVIIQRTTIASLFIVKSDHFRVALAG